MSTYWQISGIYGEACNCEAACPCVFLSPPTTGECTALVGWHVEEGAFDETDLSGLNAALAVYCPGNMAEERWTVVLYLDERADSAQTDALTQVFAGRAGGHFAMIADHIGEVLDVHSTAIDFHAEGKQRHLRIANVGDFAIEAIAGQGDQDVKVTNHPLAISPGYPAVVARSSQLTYRDHEYDWEISNRNGFFSPFTYQGP
ncbi:MAG: DUF1326 domain-containing protein [Salinibacter sp.]